MTTKTSVLAAFNLAGVAPSQKRNEMVHLCRAYGCMRGDVVASAWSAEMGKR